MASKRRIRRKACEGKRKYDTQQAAAAGRARTGYRDCISYKCRFCKQWHNGHPPKKVRQSMKARYLAASA